MIHLQEFFNKTTKNKIKINVPQNKTRRSKINKRNKTYKDK
jgi:hypothetical protein